MIDPISLSLAATAIGIGAIIGAGVAIYWRKISAWIKEVYKNLPTMIKNTLIGATAFIERVDNIFSNIMKYFSYDKNTNQWKVTTVTENIDENTIPEHIRNKLRQHNRVEITDDLEKELNLSLS